MSDRSIPFDGDGVCSKCGVRGAYDFYGDHLCQKCANDWITNKTVSSIEEMESLVEWTGQRNPTDAELDEKVAELLERQNP